jgi:hypothetical protein
MRATQVITIITNAVFGKNITNKDSVMLTNNSINYKTAQMETGPFWMWFQTSCLLE